MPSSNYIWEQETELRLMCDVVRLGLSSSASLVKENANKAAELFPLEVEADRKTSNDHVFQL
jgi:hypothetical protein